MKNSSPRARLNQSHLLKFSGSTFEASSPKLKKTKGGNHKVAPKVSSLITPDAAIALGVGAMIGAGIFSILGLIATMVSSALPFVFLLGALISAFTMYSYTKLSIRYPSIGGPVQFLIQGYGDTVLAGGLNIFQYIAYVISIAFYANGFAGYAISIFENPPTWLYKALALGIVFVFIFINLLGVKSVGNAEILIVGIKVLILVMFGIFGLFFMKSAHWHQGVTGYSFLNFLEATALISIGFQGFGVVTNAAGHMKDVKHTLPRVMTLVLAITLIVYLLVSVTVIGVAPESMLAQSSSNLLAPVAQLFMGKFGYFLLIAAALLSTSSAVNATLFGSASMAFQIARDGELPKKLFVAHEIGGRSEGIVITGLLVAALVLFFDLAPIAMMASASFLAVYTMVNIGHLRIYRETGANKAILIAGTIVTGAFLVVLFVYMVRTSEPSAWISFVSLALISFLLEKAYRNSSGRDYQKMKM